MNARKLSNQIHDKDIEIEKELKLLTKLEKKLPSAPLNNIHSFIDYLDSTTDFETTNKFGENSKYIDDSIINIALGGEKEEVLE
jgi:hypothetical protein